MDPSKDVQKNMLQVGSKLNSRLLDNNSQKTFRTYTFLRMSLERSFLIGLSMIGLRLEGTRIYNLVSFTNYMVFIRRGDNFEQKRLVQW